MIEIGVLSLVGILVAILLYLNVNNRSIPCPDCPPEKECPPCPDCPPQTGQYNTPLNSHYHFKGGIYYNTTPRQDGTNPDGRTQTLPKLFGYWWMKSTVGTPAITYLDRANNAIRFELSYLNGLHGLNFEHYLYAGKRYLIKLVLHDELITGNTPSNVQIVSRVDRELGDDIGSTKTMLNTHTLTPQQTEYIWVIDPSTDQMYTINAGVYINDPNVQGAVEFSQFSIEEVPNTDYSDAVYEV